MSTIMKLAAGHAAALLMASSTAGLAGGTQPRTGSDIDLMCQSLHPDFCPALVEAIENIADGRTLRLREDGPASEEADLTLRFVEEHATDSAIAGHLAWETAEGRTGRGESLELTVMDAQINARLLSDYALTLLKASSLPLQRR